MKIPEDKQKHLIAGFLIALVALAFFGISVAWIAVATAAIGKELYDLYLNQQAEKAGILPVHTVDLLDAIATIAGGAAILLPIMLLL